MLASGASSPEALERMIGGGKRDWERYAAGEVVPSAYRKGNEGIAMLVAKKFPQTLRVLDHSLWIALAIHHPFTESETDQLLLQLNEKVWRPFFITNDAGVKVRNWGYLKGAIWDWPDTPELIMDYLVAYLFFLKEARIFRDFKTEENAASWIHAVLSKTIHRCPILDGISEDISELLSQRFLCRP